MKKTLLTVAAAAVAVTCLAWAQPPQGAKETVVIKEEASAAKKKPAETLDKPGSTPKPRVTRDPFVPGGVAPEQPPPPPDIKQLPDQTGKPTPDSGDSVVVPPPGKPGPVVVAPEVEIKGILLSPKGNRAIVAGPSMTFIVKQGDKLGDYKVALIEQKAVTFSFKDKKFAVKMPDQFAPPKK